MTEIPVSTFQEALQEGLSELLGKEAAASLAEETQEHPAGASWLNGFDDGLRKRYGLIPAQGIAFRAGRLALLVYVQHSRQMSLNTLAFRLQPVLQRLADGLTQMNDQLIRELPVPLVIAETDEAYVLALTDVPIVSVYVFCGFFQEFLEWISNGKTFSFRLEESAPRAWRIFFQKEPVDHG